MQSKLKLTGEELQRLPVAAELTNVSIGTVQKVGNVLSVRVSVRDAANLYELGKLISTVSAEDVKAFNAMKEAEAKKAAEKDGKKK